MVSRTTVQNHRAACTAATIPRTMQFVLRLWVRYKQTDETEKPITWTSLLLWHRKSKVITTGNLPPLVIPLQPNPSALCHSVFRQHHYPSHLSPVSHIHPSLLVLSHADKEVCAISRNWFLFYYSVVNLFSFLSSTLWHPLASVFTISRFWSVGDYKIFLSQSSFHQRALFICRTLVSSSFIIHLLFLAVIHPLKIVSMTICLCKNCHCASPIAVTVPRITSTHNSSSNFSVGYSARYWRLLHKVSELSF